ncbi:hypothetical protein HPB50_001348 [Hyalomma asiaticum]|uniref:Uncharacterized protein n=1 Tax=Hyalomma asiaticum TaxID=266040 RepID=A0ACB7TAE3_HYAAI|nr:hypothetical protein HPB50_001348 [Hyalomma asiaticum]
MKWLCALLPVAWLQGVACARAWRVLADKGATATIPSVHVGGDDDEYYLEDTGEKEYYYYDQDEYYEYFQDRKPIASLRNRRIEKAIRKLRRLAEAATLLATVILLAALGQAACQGRPADEYYDEETYYDDKAADGSADFSADLTYAQYEEGKQVYCLMQAPDPSFPLTAMTRFEDSQQNYH